MSKFNEFTLLNAAPGSGVFLIGYQGTDEVRVEVPTLLSGLVKSNEKLALTPAALAGSAADSSLSITQTLNTTGSPTVFDVNVTNTASGANTLLLDLKVGGSSKFSVSKDGFLRLVSGGNGAGAPPVLSNDGENGISNQAAFGLVVSSAVGGDFFGVGYSSVRIGSAATLAWVNGASVRGGTDVDTFLSRGGGAAIVQMGVNHANTPTTQTFKAHNVTTGTGANLAIKGGTGSVANGQPFFEGPGRVEISDASSQLSAIAATLFDHGLAAPPLNALVQISSPISSDVTVEFASAGSLQLQWNIRLQESLDGSTWTESGVFFELGDGLSINAYLAGFTADTTYYFRWRSEAKNNKDVYSDWSATETFTTPS